MVGAVDLLIDGKGTLGVTQSAVEIALGLKNLSDVVGITGHVRVVGAVDLLIDGKGALGVTQSAVEIALVLKNLSDVVGTDGHVGWSGP